MGTSFGAARPVGARQLGRAIGALLFAAVLLVPGQLVRASPAPGDGRSVAPQFAGEEVDARLGGSRDSFEDAYGYPIADEPENYPLGWAYEVAGIGVAYAYFEDDQLIHLTVAPAGGSWSQDELNDAVLAFVPLDIQDVRDWEPTAESAGFCAYSDALSEEIDPDIYNTYGLAGDPGDFCVYVWLTEQGEVGAIEFALGGEGQGGGGGGSGGGGGNADGSDAEAEYLAILYAEFDALTETVEAFNALLYGPGVDQQTASDTLTWIISTWIGAYETAQSLTPPAGLEDVHDAYLVFTELFAGAAMDIANNDLDSAVTKLEYAQTQGQFLANLIAETLG